MTSPINCALGEPVPVKPFTVPKNSAGKKVTFSDETRVIYPVRAHCQSRVIDALGQTLKQRVGKISVNYAYVVWIEITMIPDESNPNKKKLQCRVVKIPLDKKSEWVVVTPFSCVVTKEAEDGWLEVDFKGSKDSV